MTLEELLGNELYEQVKQKLDEVNGQEPDKLKHIRFADLSEGNYVGKGKFDALGEQLNATKNELESANGLIAELKKSTKGNEELQSKIGDYEGEIEKLQEELYETKIKSAIKVALLSADAKDIDYVSYKLRENITDAEKAIELDDEGNIKGWNDMLSDLKVQLPSMFPGESEDADGRKILDPNKLHKSDNRDATPTKDEFKSMTYEQRVALKAQNEQLYRELSRN